MKQFGFRLRGNLTILAFLMILALLPATSFAVVGDVTLTGLPPNTTVTLTNDATGEKEDRRTDVGGIVTFSLGGKKWAGGSYTVTARGETGKIQLKDVPKQTVAVPPLRALRPPLRFGSEWFIQAGWGQSWTHNNDIKLKDPFFTLTLNSVDFNRSFAFDKRFGHWFDSFPYFGLGLDISHDRPSVDSQMVTGCIPGFCFETDVSRVRASRTNIGFDVMARLPLSPWDDRFRPYVTVGPTIAIVGLRDSQNFSASRKEKDTSVRAGVKAGVGMVYQAHPNFGIFGEYNFKHDPVKAEFRDDFGNKIKLNTSLNTHTLLGGIVLSLPCMLSC